jgi:flavin reductase (DIM6/NTAB) family NADH-FMN oxidoreductase RutF
MSSSPVVRATDPASLRSVLGHFMTGVTVVTAAPDGTPVGMTVNSFTSVSLDPPLVLFCASSWSTTGALVVGSGAFAVNILGSDQQAVAERFASSAPGRFAGMRVGTGSTSSPILLDGLAFVECRVRDHFSAGDHVVVIGDVLDAQVLRSGGPLAFFRGCFVAGPAA